MAKITWEELVRMSDEELNEICDCGMFNEAIGGYLILAMQEASFDREDIAKALSHMPFILEDFSAADATAALRKFEGGQDE